MFFEDGKGSGRKAGVNSKNRILSSAIAGTIEHDANHTNELAFNVLFSQAPTANDDAIFYMENGSDTDMTAENVILSVDAACEVYIQIGDTGTRNLATPLIPVNLNVGSGREAQGDFEVGADLDGGASTLTDGKEIERYVFRTAIDSRTYNFNQDVILKKNRTLTIWCNTAGVTVTATVVFNYHDKLGE
jgi:hypothetical protein